MAAINPRRIHEQVRILISGTMHDEPSGDDYNAAGVVADPTVQVDILSPVYRERAQWYVLATAANGFNNYLTYPEAAFRSADPMAGPDLTNNATFRFHRQGWPVPVLFTWNRVNRLYSDNSVVSSTADSLTMAGTASVTSDVTIAIPGTVDSYVRLEDCKIYVPWF